MRYLWSCPDLSKDRVLLNFGEMVMELQWVPDFSRIYEIAYSTDIKHFAVELSSSTYEKDTSESEPENTEKG